MKDTVSRRYLSAILAISIAGAAVQTAHACSRAMYVGPDSTIITVRSNDWFGSQGTNLWMYPRGLERDGNAGPGSITWTSKYGSVTAGGYEATTIDGMNERGLAANVLYLAESDYGKPAAGDQRKPLSLSAWGQFVLDNYATVAEAVTALRAEPFYLAPVATPDGHAGTAHLAISDPSGDSAIFEYISGKLIIHHGPEYRVMMNSSPFDQQLALNTYWNNINIDSLAMLPGTNRAADRFVRASYFMGAIKKTSNITEALAGAISVIRNVLVPVGIITPGQPDVSSTQWRTMSDQKNMVYYFESARSPYLLRMDLKDFDFLNGASVKKLTLTDGSALIVDGQYISGNAAPYFKPTKPFILLAAEI